MRPPVHRRQARQIRRSGTSRMSVDLPKLSRAPAHRCRSSSGLWSARPPSTVAATRVLALNYGKRTPIVTIAAHMLYGACRRTVVGSRLGTLAGTDGKTRSRWRALVAHQSPAVMGRPGELVSTSGSQLQVAGAGER